MTVFVDTSAFYALLDPDGKEYQPALAALVALRERRRPLITHEYVVVETFSLTQRRLGLTAAGRFVSELLPLVDEVWVDRQLQREAIEAVFAGGIRGTSLVDRTSFLVMRRHGITTAFAFDADFAAQGFEVIPAVRE